VNIELIEKLWSKTVLRGGCWLIPTPAKQGYASITTNGESYHIHRISLCIYLGLEYEGRWLACHTCKNKNCWNPCHLYQGDSADNIKDRDRELGHHNNRKTHCPQGHEYTPENTYLIRGSRLCKTCAKGKASDRYYKRKRVENDTRS
jgi:hypothetical protein